MGGCDHEAGETMPTPQGKVWSIVVVTESSRREGCQLDIKQIERITLTFRICRLSPLQYRSAIRTAASLTIASPTRSKSS